MDNDQTESGAERSGEEVAWDQEFAAPSNTATNVSSTLSDLAKLVVQVPTAIVHTMGVMFPEDTRRHARAAARESFLAMRSLLGAAGDGIESLLAESEAGGKPQATVSGPAGTWGTAKATGGTSAADTSSKARRIAIDEDSGVETGTSTGATPAQGDEDVPEDRGLRANIDY